MAKQAASAKPMTKTEVMNALAEKTELTKKQVGAVLEALGEVISSQLGKKGPGQFTIPGLVKMKVREKKAIPAGMRKDPFTGEMRHMPAKPASRTVRVSALKKLTDSI